MIDTLTAINYLQQVVDWLREEKQRLERESDELNAQKKQLVLDVEALATAKTAFYKQTGIQTRANERGKKMYELAVKMKKEIDDKSL